MTLLARRASVVVDWFGEIAAGVLFFGLAAVAVGSLTAVPIFMLFHWF